METSFAQHYTSYSSLSGALRAPVAADVDATKDKTGRHHPRTTQEDDSPPRRPHSELFPDARDLHIDSASTAAVAALSHASSPSTTMSTTSMTHPQLVLTNVHGHTTSATIDSAPAESWSTLRSEPAYVPSTYDNLPRDDFNFSRPASPVLQDTFCNSLGIYNPEEIDSFWRIPCNIPQPSTPYFSADTYPYRTAFKPYLHSQPEAQGPLTVDPTLVYTPPPYSALPELVGDDGEDAFSVDELSTPAFTAGPLPVFVSSPSLPAAIETPLAIAHAQCVNEPHSPLITSEPLVAPTPSNKRKRDVSEAEPERAARSPSPERAVEAARMDDDDDDEYAAAELDDEDEEYSARTSVPRKRRALSSATRTGRPAVRGSTTKRGRRPPPEQKFSCDDCGERFARTYDRDRHRKNKHPADGQASNMACPICHNKYSRSDALKRHMNTTSRCKRLQEARDRQTEPAT